MERNIVRAFWKWLVSRTHVLEIRRMYNKSCCSRPNHNWIHSPASSEVVQYVFPEVMVSLGPTVASPKAPLSNIDWTLVEGCQFVCFPWKIKCWFWCWAFPIGEPCCNLCLPFEYTENHFFGFQIRFQIRFDVSAKTSLKFDQPPKTTFFRN